MNKIAVVTGYVPLNVQHMNTLEFKDYLQQLEHAVYPVRMQTYDNYRYAECWLARCNPPMIGANPRAEDRFKTDEDHARNNVVCCQFVDWALQTSRYIEADVIVAMTATVMKQGDFTGKRVKAEHIQEFLRHVETYDFKDIPFPGITGVRGSVDPVGHNWRFTGAVHIWPVKWLPHIAHVFKIKTLSFIARHGKTPLDLQIWPEVERCSGLPFRFYQAEYDATQFTNFPDQ